MKEKLKKVKISKSQIMTIVLAGVVSTIMSLGTSYASNNYLYNSSDVSYDNTVSGITATDVQGAVDELYFHAVDYSEIKNKIGNNELTTTSDTLTGAINELDDLIGNVQNKTSKSFTIDSAQVSRFSINANGSRVINNVFYISLRLNALTSISTGEIKVGKFANVTTVTSLFTTFGRTSDSVYLGIATMTQGGDLYINPTTSIGSNQIIQINCAVPIA